MTVPPGKRAQVLLEIFEVMDTSLGAVLVTLTTSSTASIPSSGVTAKGACMHRAPRRPPV